MFAAEAEATLRMMLANMASLMSVVFFMCFLFPLG